MTQLIAVIQIMSIVGLGFLLAKIRTLDLKTLSSVGMYLFIPALLLKGLYTSKIVAGEVLALFSLFLIQFLLIGVIAFFSSRKLKLAKTSQYSFILSTVAPNAGMMGISVVLVGFGEGAAGTAAFIYALSAVFMNTVGLFLAAGGVLDWKSSLSNTVRMPPLVAVVLAIILNISHVKIPETILFPIVSMSGAAVPLMLVLLGGQISTIHKFSNKLVILIGSLIRLIIAPIIAYLLVTFVIPLPDAIAPIFIIQVSMPTGINTIALTTEFGSDAELVASITSLSVLLSILTIPVLLMIFA